MTLDQYFLKMLALVATRGTCPRRQVGCIITDVKGRVLSTGYNGSPSGLPHCIDSPCPGILDQKGDSSRCIAVHAEQNALLQCHRLDLAHTLYTGVLPCFTCAKLICNTSIQRVVYLGTYSELMGLELLTMKGIQVDHVVEG